MAPPPTFQEPFFLPGCGESFVLYNNVLYRIKHSDTDLVSQASKEEIIHTVVRTLNYSSDRGDTVGSTFRDLTDNVSYCSLNGGEPWGEGDNPLALWIPDIILNNGIKADISILHWDTGNYTLTRVLRLDNEPVTDLEKLSIRQHAARSYTEYPNYKAEAIGSLLCSTHSWCDRPSSHSYTYSAVWENNIGPRCAIRPHHGCPILIEFYASIGFEINTRQVRKEVEMLVMDLLVLRTQAETTVRLRNGQEVEIRCCISHKPPQYREYSSLRDRP